MKALVKADQPAAGGTLTPPPGESAGWAGAAGQGWDHHQGSRSPAPTVRAGPASSGPSCPGPLERARAPDPPWHHLQVHSLLTPHGETAAALAAGCEDQTDAAWPQGRLSRSARPLDPRTGAWFAQRPSPRQEGWRSGAGAWHRGGARHHWKEKGSTSYAEPAGKGQGASFPGGHRSPSRCYEELRGSTANSLPREGGLGCTPGGGLPSPDQLSAPAAQPSGLTALQNRESQRPAADGTKQGLLRAKRLPRTAARAWGGDEKGNCLPSGFLTARPAHVASCLQPLAPPAPQQAPVLGLDLSYV